MDQSTDSRVGTVVGQYTIVAKLGGGGMGVVYSARDSRLGRLVALKFLPPAWSHDEPVKQRFIREAQAASATDHRNICTIHNIDTAADGQLFIVMAHYSGETLKQRLKAEPLTIDEAVEIAAQVAEGLAKAHAQGVVHRDIKPGNLMLVDDCVKILDFGLAKFADSLQLTIVGSTVGTVAYMAPEQARGEEADGRSDIWAVGVVLYEMLAGHVPFKGGYPEAISHAIKHETPAPLNTPDRPIPEALERLVLRALEKDPAQRFQSARELARQLRTIQGRTLPFDFTGPLSPPPQPLPGPQPRWKLPMYVPVAVLVAVVALLYLWATWREEQISVAIAPVANHTGDPQLDEYRLALTYRLQTELRHGPSIRAVPYTRLLEIVRRFTAPSEDISSRDAIQAIAAQSGARIVVIPTLQNRGGTWLARAELRSADTGTNTDVIETEAVSSSLPKETAYRLMASLALVIRDRFGPGGFLDGVLVRLHVGLPLRQRAHALVYGSAVSPRDGFRNIESALAFERGLNLYEQMEYAAALASFRAAAVSDNQHSLIQAWLSRTLLILSQGNEAAEAARQTEQLLASGTPEADVLLVRAVVAESQSDVAAAERSYRRLASTRPGDSSAVVELADFLKRQNRNDQAVRVYQEVLQADAGFIRPHVDLCQLYLRIDEQALAEAQAATALEMFRRAGNRGGEGQALLCLGDAQREQGGTHMVDAKRNIEAARAIFDSLGAAYNLARAYQYLGTVAYNDFDYPAAIGFFEEARKRSHAVGNRQIEAVVLFNLGVVQGELGAPAKVLEYFRQSRDLYQQMGDERRAAEQDVDTADLLVNYGGDQDDAMRRLAAASATLQKLGDVEFEVSAMRVEAARHRNAGSYAQALRRLHEALTLSKERAHSRIASVTVDLGQTHLLSSEYEAARGLLEEMVNSDMGRGDLEAAIVLGRAYVRLGEFEAARPHLRRALDAVEAGQQRRLAPSLYAALGELAYESGDLSAARAQFEKAAIGWTADLPDAASVEARCYLASLSAMSGNGGAGAPIAQAALDRASQMKRRSLEAHCRLQLARVHVSARRYAEAVRVLGEIPADGEATIGPELRGQVHYWRSRALTETGGASTAVAEAALAKKLAADLQASLPDRYRRGFAARATIRSILQ